MSTLIKITNLSKTYLRAGARVPVIENFSIEAEAGEIICIFGRSGSGKTTLLNLIGTLDTPNSGEILIDGINVMGLKGKDLSKFRLKNIGFVFQYFNLIPYLTALENTVLPLKYDGVSKKNREEKAKLLLSELGLADRINFRPYELSGGQVQRVSFARASINNPRIILADEPTGQLDLQSAKELASLIKKLNKEKNLTFIIATHDSAIEEIADRKISL